MIKGEVKKGNQLTKENILEKTDDYNIFRYYLGQDFNFKKSYKSLFRVDKTPNLRFTGDPVTGKIIFKDFANGKGGDCFKFVQELFNLNFFEALTKIDEDLGLGLKSHKTPVFKIHKVEKPSIHKQSKLIQIVPRYFTYEDLSYWHNYRITFQELNKKNVYSVDKLYLNKQLIPTKLGQIRFAYLFDEYLKIYTPFSLDYKWISSCPNDFISGFDDIKYKIFTGTQDKKLIISKSVKDEIVLSKFFKDVCSTQNESLEALNQENIDYILRGYKPEDVYIAYDSDQAGVRASTLITKKYGFNYVNVPKVFMIEGIKDFADLVMHKGLDTLENYLKIKKLI